MSADREPAGGDELVSRARRGDDEALGELLEREGPDIRARLRVPAAYRSIVDADDVMQVSYVEAHLRVNALREGTGAAFRAWLGRVAENNLRDAIRGLERQKRPDALRRAAPSAEPHTTLLEQLADGGKSVGALATEDEARAVLCDALARLPASYREVVSLYDLEELTADQVAGRMGRSRGAIYMTRARAHDRLRELLGPSSDFFAE